MENCLAAPETFKITNCNWYYDCFIIWNLVHLIVNQLTCPFTHCNL